MELPDQALAGCGRTAEVRVAVAVANVCQRCNRGAEEVGVQSPHALRHVCQSMMIAAGVPYAESEFLLGQRLRGPAAATSTRPT